MMCPSPCSTAADQESRAERSGYHDAMVTTDSSRSFRRDMSRTVNFLVIVLQDLVVVLQDCAGFYARRGNLQSFFKINPTAQKGTNLYVLGVLAGKLRATRSIDNRMQLFLAGLKDLCLSLL